MTLPVTPAAYARLDALGHIAFSGEDAANFLHNQLTNDVLHLGQDEARLAAYCTPKGRMLASFLMWQDAGAIVLQLPREILPALQKRLQMFVLRAKVKVAEAPLHAFGLLGAEAVKGFGLAALAAPWQAVHGDHGSLVRLPDADGVARHLWIATAAQEAALLPKLGLAEVPAAAFRLSEIRAGIPQIVAATQEQFVPQMVNFELLGGVNFRKGCYPGQEIVARSQYLGKLKRRMLLAAVDAPAAAAMEIFAAADPEQPCGMVVNAEADGAGSALLVEIKVALADGAIHLGSASGPQLRFAPLPYPIVDPAEQA